MFSRIVSMYGRIFGAWAMMKSGYAPMSGNTLLFWAVAVILIVGIQMARGRRLSAPASLRAYIAGGALAFTLVGCILGQAGMILGAVIGVFLGGVAYMRVHRPHGPRYWALVVGIATPTVATAVLTAMTVVALIARSGAGA